LETVLTFTFDEPLDQNTVMETNILVQGLDGAPIIGEIYYDLDTMEVTFTPSDHLDPYTTYSVLLRGDIADLAGNGIESGMGISWFFTSVGILPGQPRSVTADGEETGITITWSAPSELGSGAFLGYNVFRMRDDGSGTGFELLTNTGSTTLFDGQVEPMVVYHYHVVACSSYGDGEPSDVASATLVLPPEDPEDPDPYPNPEDPEDPVPQDTTDDPNISDNGYGGWLAAMIAFVVVAVVAGYRYLRLSKK
jgi:hypothetical protein